MTSKERAALRGQANKLEPLFQVGKGGISDALIKQTDDALNARELIKLKVLLESAPEKPKEIANKLAQATQSEVVGVSQLHAEMFLPKVGSVQSKLRVLWDNGGEVIGQGASIAAQSGSIAHDAFSV